MKIAETCDRYLHDSQYGRILTSYLDFFPRHQLLITFTEELDARPGVVVDAILAFLGLDPGFKPRSLSRKFHLGGSSEQFPGLISLLKRIWPVRAAWHLLPAARRRALWMHWFTEINVVKDSATAIPQPLRRTLAAFFREDVTILQKLTGVSAPWRDFDGRD